MRAARSIPPLVGALAALLATARGAPPDHPPQETQQYILCKYEQMCMAWPHNAGYLTVQHRPNFCGITSSRPKPQQFNTMELLGLKGVEAMAKVYCVFVYVMGERGGRGGRVARQAGAPPRGRFRGQTQSQYLAVEHGGDEGKAEAHSAADSSRASVSGNSGMGQAQSQSMYDPSCDDCYGGGGPEVGSLKNRPYGLNVNNNNGFGPSRTDGQSWAGPEGRVGPTGNNQNGGSRLGSYGPSQPGTQGYQYYGMPGSSNNFPPSVGTGIEPDKNRNYPTGQGGISQGPGPGQESLHGPLSPGSQSTTGSLGPGLGASVTGYGPGQQGYGGYAPTLIRPGQDNNLGNRYDPSQNGGSGNYGPGLTGSPGGESNAPGSLMNPPSTGLRPIQSVINAGSQPNQNDLPGNYNQIKPFGNGYQSGGDPGNYKPGPNGVFRPGSSGNIPNSISRDVIPNSQSPHISGGVYSPSPDSTPGGLSSDTNPQSNINTNQGTAPGIVYKPDQIGGKNVLGQPQGGNWPLASYSPGSSPYFCCVVGPDGNLMPAGGGPYSRGQGFNNQYPNVNNQYGQIKPVFGPGSNDLQTGPSYVPSQNNLIHGQEGLPPMGLDQGFNAFNNNYGPRQGVPNANNNYGPPANMALPPGHMVSYGSGGSSRPTGDGNYLNPDLDSGAGRGYIPGQNGGSNNVNYKPVGGVGPGTGSIPGPGGSYVEGGSGVPSSGNYSPNQGTSVNVGRYVPGNVGPPNMGGVIRPSQVVGPNTGGSYGPVTYPGKSVDGAYSPVHSTIPGSGGYFPGQSGVTGGSYSPQQSETLENKMGYGTSPHVGPGGIENYNTGQNPTGSIGNYLPGQVSGQGGVPNYVQSSGYGPGSGYLPDQRKTQEENNFGLGPLDKAGTIGHYGIGSHPGQSGNIFGTNSVGEPSNMQSYGPGTNVGPTSSGYGPSQNGNSNGLPGSGNLGPGNNGLGNVGGYNPSQSVGIGGQGIYEPGQDVMGQSGRYTPGVMGRQNIYGTDLPSGYGGGPVENTYDARFTGQNKENSVPQNFTDPNIFADGDDSEAEASVSQAANGTTASASSKGGNDKGRAQTNVQGTYTGSGSFSAQAQITGENKEAESEVSGGKKGASSSAQGSGRNNKSQANVQLGSETGSVQTQSLTNGAYHSSNSQVQGSIKGGMADAQARGPGSTSSQAQIGFTPYKEGDKLHDLQKVPFVGGGVASAQSSSRTGQSQSQLHGTFKYGISYNGAAQAGGSVDKDAVFPNRLSFDKIDVFDENNKNINVETEKPTELDQPPSVDPVPPLESVLSEEVLPSPENVPQLSNLLPIESTSESGKKDEETLKNSESRYSSHTHQDHHKTSVQAPPPAPVGGTTRSFQSSYGNNGAEYEYTTDREDVQPEEYDTDGAEVEQGEYSNYDEIPRETLTHQSLQSPRKSLEVKQTTGGNTQHIVLGSLENHDAEITQRNSEQPDESKTYQPGERVPGTGGYTIPAGFTGSVKSVASKENTYVVGSKESPSQAQTVTLTPGTGRVRYSTGGHGRSVDAGQLRSLRPHARDDRYVSVSKSVARDLDAEDHVRKQYSHSYYTKSSSCGFFTFTCTMVSGAEGRKKVCRPKIPTNPDGTPIRC